MRSYYVGWLALALAVGCGPADVTPPAAHAATTASATIGAPAPDFTLTDTSGTSVSLSELRGKVVAIEWFNPDCPFIVSAHQGGPLETMPAAWTEKGVVWLTINSNAEGTQGHGVERNTKAKDEYALPRPVLLDPTGEVGRAYGAKTTPHMYLVNADGVLVYKGGLDNAPRGSAPKTGIQPFFENALTATTSGKPVQPAESKAYGCSVKYGS